jgi:hypothetical protein
MRSPLLLCLLLMATDAGAKPKPNDTSAAKAPPTAPLVRSIAVSPLGNNSGALGWVAPPRQNHDGTLLSANGGRERYTVNGTQPKTSFGFSVVNPHRTAISVVVECLDAQGKRSAAYSKTLQVPALGSANWDSATVPPTLAQRVGVANSDTVWCYLKSTASFFAFGYTTQVSHTGHYQAPISLLPFAD